MFGMGSPLDAMLDPGERLLWSGQPKQGVRLQAGDVFLIPFSLMWGGFALFWEAGVLGLIHLDSKRPANHPPIFMAVFGIPFVVIGLYMIFGRFFFDAASRKRTWYGITDRRLIILKSLFGTKILSYDYATLTNLNLVERGDRSGDVLFGASGFGGTANFGGASWPQSNRNVAVPGFYLLPGAREVYNQIRSVQQQAKK
jgi:Bacterial PH domain